ncbi:MAG: hypothetical protein JWL95_1416 [Gemmatimonadetes bacterium]|nr:hypothetical protein [Gemmatimonadota bacterium]
MLGISPWLSLVVVLLVVLLARRAIRDDDAPAPPEAREPTRAPSAAERLADRVRTMTASDWAPPIAGLLTGAATWYVWGSLRRTPVIHDESAYLLQAQLFARLHWTAATPPLPHFFEQLYVNLVPAISSKYPPGTSLLLAPGVAVGLPGLPVVVMNALAGALVFALARRLLGGVSAALGWTLWITSYPVLYYHAMYVSEVPSSLAWLLAWWGVLRWRASGRIAGLAVSAGAVALCAITRPLTAVALSIALAGAVLASLARDAQLTPRALLRVAAPFAVAGALAVGFLTLWNWRSTGDPRLSPLTLYTRTYVPFDKLGFGSTAAEAPTARLPWDQRVTSVGFYQEHLIHTVPKLPLVTLVRARTVAHDMWYDWRGGLAVMALLGLVGAPAAVWVGVMALVVQLLCYLLYAHSWSWSLYYIELQPLLAAVTALGIARACMWGAGRDAGARRHALATAVLIVAVLYPAAVTVSQVRAHIAGDHDFYDSFARLLPRAPGGSIVFVRYATSHNDGLSLVRNAPVLADAPVWTVYDRGAENARLMALAPERAAYLFDEATWTLRPLTRTADPVRSTR